MSSIGCRELDVVFGQGRSKDSFLRPCSASSAWPLSLKLQPVSVNFYYPSGEPFRIIDSTGTLVEYIIDPAVTQINRSTIAPGAPGILNLSSLSGMAEPRQPATGDEETQNANRAEG